MLNGINHSDIGLGIDLLLSDHATHALKSAAKAVYTGLLPRLWLLSATTGVMQASWAGGLLNHSDSQITALSAYQLSDIFTLKQKNWPNGLRVQIILLKQDSPEYVEFITEKLGIFPYQLKRHWKRVNFSGRGQPPMFVDSVPQLISQIADNPGAIGYLPGEIQDYVLTQSLPKEVQGVEISP